MDIDDKRLAARVFWGSQLLIWAVLLVIFVVQAHQLGRGIGIGDGRNNPGGQMYIDGEFDGVKAVGR